MSSPETLAAAAEHGGFVLSFIKLLTIFATDLLMPFMVIMFFFAVAFRILIYYTIRREDSYSKEFEKQVNQFIEEEDHKTEHSFYMLSKRLLEKSYYELFEVRSIMKRRKQDAIMALSDRIFLIQHGSARLVKDALKQIKFIKFDGNPPKLLEISKNIFQNNPCFNKVFGILPIGLFNDMLGILPGIFIVGGIFGTFLGIMGALPELVGMDLQDIEGTKLKMDSFLASVSFSMSTSIIGIILSVSMTFVNAAFAPEKLFVTLVERFEGCLNLLWHRSSNNKLPNEIPEFNEHKDPVAALAEEALNREFNKENPGIKEAIAGFRAKKSQSNPDLNMKTKELLDESKDNLSPPEMPKPNKRSGDGKAS